MGCLEHGRLNETWDEQSPFETCVWLFCVNSHQIMNGSKTLLQSSILSHTTKTGSRPWRQTTRCSRDAYEFFTVRIATKLWMRKLFSDHESCFWIQHWKPSEGYDVTSLNLLSVPDSLVVVWEARPPYMEWFQHAQNHSRKGGERVGWSSRSLIVKHVCSMATPDL